MFGISFLSPLFLVAAVAAAVPILLHLFHRRTERVIDFPAVRLLTRAPAAQHRRRRLRELVLLALRVAALVVLAVSFARPYLAGAVAPGAAPLTVIAVDTSLSLSAPGQFAQAREAAERAVAAAPESHAVALVSFADAAAVVVEPTMDRQAVRSALAGLEPGAGGTRYRTALARATELLGARDGQVVVVTDLQQAGWDASDAGGLPDGIEVAIAAVAPPAGNLAVTAAERRDARIVASLQNFAALEARTTVRLFADGQERTATTVTLAPLAAVDVELAATLPRTGTVEVRVDDSTGYQRDNSRTVPLDPSPLVPVAIVVADPTGQTGGLYLERALEVADGGREFEVHVADGRAFSAWPAAEVQRQGAVFVLGTRTLDRSGRERLRGYLAGGGRVFLTLGPDVDAGTLADVIGVPIAFAASPVRTPGATLVASDGRHPIFRPFLNPSGALGDVQVDQHRRLKDHADRTVLARFSGGDAALTEQTVGEGVLLVFTSDLDNQWSRFPLNPAFVPFAVETARYLTRRRQPAAAPATPADVRESNPATTTVAGFTAAIERTSRAGSTEAGDPAREIEDRQRWWQIGLLIMLAALAGEALVGRRAT
jgi:hypothetical protein